MNRRHRIVPVFGGGDTTAPSVATFTVATPSNALAVPIAAFTASEAGASFCITESSTPPAVDDAGWSATAQTTHTVSTYGTYTLYPWVKDAAGNVSSVYASPATVLVQLLYFLDLFTGADTTALTSHTPNTDISGNGWSNINGTFTILSNRARSATGGSPLFSLATMDVGKADVSIRCIVNTPGAGYSGVIFRLTDANNFWAALINAGTDNLYLFEYASGFTQRGIASVAINTDTDYTIDVVCTGTSISVKLDSANEITYTSSANQTATKHGIRGDDVARLFDNFQVGSPNFT